VTIPVAPKIDLAALLVRAGNDDDLMREVIGDFLAGSHELVTSVVTAAAAGDHGAAAAHAHRIRGALLALSAGPAALAAGEVEQLAANVGTATADASAERLAAAVRVFVEVVASVSLEMRRFLEG